jgi:hypothetical protein
MDSISLLPPLFSIAQGRKKRKNARQAGDSRQAEDRLGVKYDFLLLGNAKTGPQLGRRGRLLVSNMKESELA